MPILNDIPSVGIASLINLESKEHYTLYSTALPIELAKLVESLRKGTHASPELIQAYKDNKLTFKILETYARNADSLVLYSLRASYTEWLKEFASKGYKDLRPGHKAPTYRITKKIYPPYDPDLELPLVYVIAVSKRNNKLVLGGFSTVVEADAWIKESFPEPANAVPQFHDGELSRGYRKDFGERLIKLKRHKKARNRVRNTL